MPKLQTSCSTVCTDGMVVETSSPEVVQARASVFEFLLINHPLDCPVCDKGGECPLQDYLVHVRARRAAAWSSRAARSTARASAADVDFGPTLMLNRNRCIMCTRCVRFMKEIDGDAQIGVVDRGGHSEIATFEERGVHSLISGNLMDVCPVGAITTRDYRFKSRPVGQPAGRRHHVHAVLEGLQHDGVAQGEARVGEGRAAHPLHAAVQPGGQRLLDVRHRPLPVPLGRRRHAADARRSCGRTSGAQAQSTWPGALARVREPLLPIVKDAAGGVPHARVGPRVARGAVPRPRARGAGCRARALDRARRRVVAVVREGAARRARSSRCRRWTRPTWPARARWASACPDGAEAACDISGPARGRRVRRGEGALRDRPRARGQHRRRAVGDRRAHGRHAAAAHRAGRA